MNNTREKIESGYSYHNGIWSGGEPNYEQLTGSFGSFLYRRLYDRQNEIFQIDPYTKTIQSCGEILEQAKNFSIYLKHVKNINVGDVVVFCTNNDKYSIILVLTAIFLGLPIICIHQALEPDEINRIFDIIKPNLLICEKDSLPKFTNKKLKHIIEKNANFDINYLSPSKTVRDFTPEAVDATKAILLFMCTSGLTTGLRRVVPYTQAFFYNTLYRMQNIVTHHDILLNSLSFCHSGAIWSLLYCLTFGSKYIATKWSSSMNILKLIQEYKVTCLNIYTDNLLFICSNPKLSKFPQMKNLRLIWSRGKPNPKDQMKFMRSVLECTHIVNYYACVEFGGLVAHFDSTYEYDMNIIKVNSVGRLRRGCEAKIVDIKTRKILGPNQHGELMIKTNCMPQKYLNSESRFTDDDGWFPTGDYAKFDDEQCLYVIADIQNLLHVESNLISPYDIEYIIIRMPSVRQCSVVGIQDQVLGELPTAFVVKEPNAEVTEKEIIKTVALDGKGDYRLLGGVYFMSKLPTTAVGGISKEELVKLFKILPPTNSCKCGRI